MIEEKELLEFDISRDSTNPEEDEDWIKTKENKERERKIHDKLEEEYGRE